MDTRQTQHAQNTFAHYFSVRLKINATVPVPDRFVKKECPAKKRGENQFSAQYGHFHSSQFSFQVQDCRAVVGEAEILLVFVA